MKSYIISAKLEPRSLSAIWSDIHRKRFRVRHVETLIDYCVIDIKCWMQGLPHYVEMVMCDGLTFTRYSQDSWTRQWALLSTREELEFLNSLQTQQAAFKVKCRYRGLGCNQ